MTDDSENPVSDVLFGKMVDEDELEDFEFSKDTSPKYITDVVGRVAKARRYVSDPSDAPEGVEVEEGPQGGYFYETGGTGEADIRDEPEDIDGVEMDGVNVTEGTEFEWEDGSTVTVEGLYEDEDGQVQVSISDESTDATSVDIEDIEEQVEAGNLTPTNEGDLDTGGFGEETSDGVDDVGFDTEPSEMSDEEIRDQHTELENLQQQDLDAGHQEGARRIAERRQELWEEAEDRGIDLGEFGEDPQEESPSPEELWNSPVVVHEEMRDDELDEYADYLWDRHDDAREANDDDEMKEVMEELRAVDSERLSRTEEE